MKTNKKNVTPSKYFTVLMLEKDGKTDDIREASALLAEDEIAKRALKSVQDDMGGNKSIDKTLSLFEQGEDIFVLEMADMYQKQHTMLLMFIRLDESTAEKSLDQITEDSGLDVREELAKKMITLGKGVKNSYVAPMLEILNQKERFKKETIEE